MRGYLLLVLALTGPGCFSAPEPVDGSAPQSTTTSGPSTPAGPVTSDDPDSGNPQNPSTTTDEPDEGSDGEPEGFDIASDAWLIGPAPQVVDGPRVLALRSRRDGAPLWVSNNPERIFGNGWLMQAARMDSVRGGEPVSLSELVAYAFHLNASEAPLFISWVVGNPNPESIRVHVRGSVYDNADYPLDGSVGAGPSSAVVRDTLLGEYEVVREDVVVTSTTAAVLHTHQLDPGQLLDARFSVEADGNVFMYAVATTTQDATAVVNATQGMAASGEIREPGPNAYGRMAGIYEHARLELDGRVEVPAQSQRHIAVALNTDAKFAYGGATLPDLTMAARMHLNDSSDQSFGNYGVEVAVNLELCSDRPRMVRIYLAAHVQGETDEPSFTWDGPFLVDGELVEARTTPTAPRAELDTRTLSGGCEYVVLRTIVPGLITTGQQLILEAL